MKKSKTGFTLIELLVVITIIATLATVVFVALNPAQRLADARNSRRWSDVETILTAVHQSIVDTGGVVPAGIGLSATQLGVGGSGCLAANCLSIGTTACTDLSVTLAKYLKSLPIDPQGSSVSTGYSIVKDANNIITVNACKAEVGTTITVSR